MTLPSPRVVAALAALCLSALCLQPASAVFAQVNEVGVNAHIPEEALLEGIEGLRVGWIRVDANWNQLEPASGSYRWEVLDPAVTSAGARGIEVFVTLAYTPEWVPRVPSTRGDHAGNDEPVGSAEWVSFVEAAVRHYRALGVTHFGLWNEANLDGFFEGTADAYYDKIVVPGAAAVRRACGDCLVLGPDLAHVGDVDVFLARLLERGIGDQVDIFTHHNYHGFTETGASVLSGDTFLNALEMRRFPFTRASLRELLDAAGYAGEVWITETGYEAERIGDAREEDRQATYYRRVLEEQLERSWWTNTFFYEIMDCGIDQPECTIDGYGITRPARPITGGRGWPDDFRRKPAYDLLRDFIAAHPEIGPEGTEPPPPPDGDGGTSATDAGVSAADGGGSAVDASSPGVDAAVTPTPDGGTGDGPVAAAPGDAAGCGCAATGRGGAPGTRWLVPALLLWAGLRRRRP